MLTSGHTIVKVRSGLPEGEGMMVDVDGHPSMKYKKGK